jgi:hypothetical protein
VQTSAPVRCGSPVSLLKTFHRMRFSDEQLKRFAEWESVVPGFDRNVAYNDDQAIHRHISPLIAEITASGQLTSHQFEDGGLSNHFAFFLHHSSDLPDVSTFEDYSAVEVPGITVYLSLLAPVGVFGRSSSQIGPRCWIWGTLEISDVRDGSEAEGELERSLLSAISKTPYQLLSRADVAEPLPAGIHPYEYCFCEEPWDKVFHALFANTD